MEKDQNPFPKIDLFPRVTRVARAIGGLFQLHQLASHGDHFVENRGGGSALDRALYDDYDRSLEDTVEFDSISEV